jgi:hypothetical protein
MDSEDHLRTFVARAFLEQSYRRFNAHRIGVGYKRVGGDFTNTLSVVFIVQTKKPRAMLDPRKQIPETLRLIDQATGEEITAKTDVVALPPAEPQMFVPGAFNRPAPGGSRISRQSDSSSAGSLGGWVWDKTDDSIVFLTNRHVIGSDIGETINQGSTGTLPNGDTLRIGAVKRAAELVELMGQSPFPMSQCSFADASIGTVDNTADIGLVTPEIGLAVFATAGVSLLQHVEMFGSITEYQQGRITLYPTQGVYPIDGQDAGMCDLFQFEPLEANGTVSGQGDSGKLVFNINNDDDPNPCVGLHFAGGGTAGGNSNYGLACPIQNVFDALDLDTLCSGGFAGFLDALFGDAVGGPGATRAVTLLQSRTHQPGFFKGISREVEARLNTTKRGSVVAGAVRKMRGDLMQLTLADGDLRRMAAVAIGPIVAGAITVDQLFARNLSANDSERLGQLFDLMDRLGNARVKSATADLRRVFTDTAGKTIGDLL